MRKSSKIVSVASSSDFALEVDVNRLVLLGRAMNLADADIAFLLDIDVKTLRDQYGVQLEKGRILVDLQVCEALYEKIRGNDLKAIQWYQACRMGWRPANPVVQVVTSVDQSEVDQNTSLLQDILSKLDKVTRQKTPTSPTEEEND